MNKKRYTPGIQPGKRVISNEEANKRADSRLAAQERRDAKRYATSQKKLKATKARIAKEEEAAATPTRESVINLGIGGLVLVGLILFAAIVVVLAQGL